MEEPWISLLKFRPKILLQLGSDFLFYHVRGVLQVISHRGRSQMPWSQGRVLPEEGAKVTGKATGQCYMGCHAYLKNMHINWKNEKIIIT